MKPKRHEKIKQLILDALTKNYRCSPVERAERLYADIDYQYRRIQESEDSKKSFTKAETDAIYEAIDIVSSTSDGATDQKYYSNLLKQLNKAWRKAIRARL